MFPFEDWLIQWGPFQAELVAICHRAFARLEFSGK
jgi:hypothetical protein